MLKSTGMTSGIRCQDDDACVRDGARGAGRPLVGRTLRERTAGAGEILARVAACAVCRTDLHVVDGELGQPKLPLIPGHEIVARVLACGPGVEGFAVGSGSASRGSAGRAGSARYCRAGRENLCPKARFTGYQIDGGYADQVVADARFCFALPDAYDDLHAAPLLCAGLIGCRSLVRAGDAQAARHLRLRRRCPYRDAGRALAGTRGLRLHARRRRRSPQAIRPRDGRDVDRPVDRGAS